MGRIYKSATQMIGNTPLLEVTHIEQEEETKGRVLVKLEYLNPAGSTKDRAALSMIEEAEREGRIQPGATLIEPTSGNTGIGLASVAAQRGYHLILTMPETMSVERRNILKAYGAKIVLTEGSLGMKGAIAKAKELQKENPGSFIPSQFENPANPKAHYNTTGPEIWEDTNETVDVLVAGVGTGGTLSGCGRFLKEKNPNIEIVAVEPDTSAVLSGGQPGPHAIQGIGAGFIPGNMDMSLVDKIITLTGEESIAMAKKMAKKEGILVGISSGAALCAAVQLAKKEEYKDKTIVAVLPDSGDRYYSTALFIEE